MGFHIFKAIKESLLTTQDDIIVRGASVAERLNIATQRLVGRITGGHVTGLTATQVRTLINVADGADVTGDNTPKAHTIASHSDTTGTGAELEELTDGSETTLHSHAAAGGATVATGNYAGNDADDRQITTGFKCSMVLVMTTSSARRVFMIPDITIFDHAALGNTVVTVRQYLHASDGFVVSATTDIMNNTGATYYYWAISE